jgi:hypothetical protein
VGGLDSPQGLGDDVGRVVDELLHLVIVAQIAQLGQRAIRRWAGRGQPPPPVSLALMSVLSTLPTFDRGRSLQT